MSKTNYRNFASRGSSVKWFLLFSPMCGLATFYSTLLPTQAQIRPQSQVLQPAEKLEIANHAFVFKADRKLKSVSLVGSFNNWDKNAHPMRVDADEVTWRLILPLRYGMYRYKFVLFGPERETWVVDPHAPLDEADKVNDNSLLMVAPPDYKLPASPDDGETAASALLHPNGVRDMSYDVGELTLAFRTRPNDLRQVRVRSAGRRYPLQVVRTDDIYAYYMAQIPWDRKRDLTYSFELVDGNRVQEYGVNGLMGKSQPFKIIAKNFQPYLLSEAPEPLKMAGPLTTQTVAGPMWAKNQPLYEVNLDVYGFPKGTALREYEKHLPVLKEMGVGLVWFMPLHPRGQEKAFGSPYAVRDYREINPDFGTKEDFRRLVQRAHELGLRVLMDWVPNHTAWDNPMLKTHPEFYAKDDTGHIKQAGSWRDVAQLDYGRPGQWNQGLWNLMRDDMAFWVREFDIDGFRCDVAGRGGKVPVEFWNWLRPQLEAIKPVFMLGEADDTYLHPAFDMTFSWNLPPVLWDVCAGRKPATAIDDTLRREARDYPTGAIRMRFLNNHDWHNHADWGWGNGPAIDTRGGMLQVPPLMVLCTTLPGKPMIYNGQEMSFLKVSPPLHAEARHGSPVWSFYSRLLGLYQTHPALSQGSFTKLVTNRDDKVYAFVRRHGNERIVVVVNLSAQPQNVTLKNARLEDEYRDWFNDQDVRLDGTLTWNLAPWAYRVFVGHANQER